MPTVQVEAVAAEPNLASSSKVTEAMEAWEAWEEPTSSICLPVCKEVEEGDVKVDSLEAEEIRSLSVSSK